MFLPSATTPRGALAADRVALQKGHAIGGRFSVAGAGTAARFRRAS